MVGHDRRSWNNFNIGGDARVHLGDQHHYHPNDARGRLLEWLKAPDHTSSHWEAQRKREEGTCLWIIQESTYESWLAGRVPLLWLHGKAGCCKTVLCSAIIDHVAKRTTSRKGQKLLYFYFSFADPARQDYRSLLLSLSAQLLQQESDDADYSELQSFRENGQRHVGALEVFFFALLNKQRTVYIVVDGLDESTEENGIREEVLNGMLAFHHQCARVRLLVSSRNEADINEHMQEKGAWIVPIHNSKVDQDVKTYVGKEIARHRKLRTLDPAFKAEIETFLSIRAGGMFRWAFCQLEHIKRLKIWTNASIRSVLHELPQTLDDTYDRILLAIDARYRKQVVAVLQWLAFVEPQLELRELVEICVTRTDEKPYVQEHDRHAWDAIVDVMSGFIETVDVTLPKKAVMAYHFPPGRVPDVPAGTYTSTNVVLSHFSVKEYLTSNRIWKGPASAFAMDPHVAAYNRSQYCIAYILHAQQHCADILRRRSTNASGHGPEVIHDEDALMDRYPLFGRAVRRWDTFQRQAEYAHGKSFPSGLELTLLRNDNEARVWCDFRDRYVRHPDCDPHTVKGEERDTCFLYMACILQLPRTVAMICRSRPGVINISSKSCGPPLLAACTKGYADIAASLLAAGADPNARQRFESPLNAACRCGDVGLVQNLIRSGADVTATRNGLTAIDNAINMSHIDVVRALLRAGARVNLVAQHGYSPLEIAAMRCQEEIVAELLQAGADINAPTQRHASALHIAAQENHVGLVKLLLRAGANVELRDPSSADTPLQSVLRREPRFAFELQPEFVQTLQLLLEAGTKVDTLQPMHVHNREVADLLRSYGARFVFLKGE